MHQSLLLLKPDTYIRGLREEVIRGVKRNGLEIQGSKVVQLDRWSLLELWPAMHTLWGWLAAQEYICGFPLEVFELHGSSAITQTLELKKQLRKKYCSVDSPDMRISMRRLVHCPDTTKDYLRESKLLLSLEVRYVPVPRLDTVHQQAVG